MHADVEQYFATIKAVEGNTDEQAAKVEELRQQCYAADEALTAARRDNRTAVAKATLVGRAALQKSEDPAVAWIAANTLREYPEHSAQILKLLPATADVLEAHAAKQGWCSDWDRELERAVEAGVIKREEPHPAVVEVLTWVRRNYGTTAVREMRPQITLMAQALRAEATAPEPATA